MFCGIIESVGKIEQVDYKGSGLHLTIYAPEILNDVHVGDSISVNGCCLTVTQFSPTHWECDVVEESMRCTNLASLQPGHSVNLERALRYQARVDGHLVQGHVDGIGKIIEKELNDDRSWKVTIETSSELLRYMIMKGSIAVDGVSLTIASLETTNFSFAMIPHTAEATTLGEKQVGHLVNIEVDLMAKYMERFQLHSLNERLS